MTYDQFGDEVEAEDGDLPPPAPHDPRCRRGWIDPDSDHPKPCLACKPHLDPDVRRRRMGLGEKK